jgi:hypothetical protein
MILLKAVTVVYLCEEGQHQHVFTVENEFLGGRLMELNDDDESLLRNSQPWRPDNVPVHGYFVTGAFYSELKPPTERTSGCTLC